jgi:hypothetical protein
MTTTLAWAECKELLAAWADVRLVVRRDVWGGFPQTTRPAKYLRGRVLLGREQLLQHFAGRCLLGLHSTSAENTSRWAALDIDHHGETSTSAEINWVAARAWYESLVRRGFKPLLEDSNGSGGFHLLTLFAEPLPTRRVFHFLKSLVADHPRHGLKASPECFPKQAAVAPPGCPGQYGNWLRVVGKHHSREFWSRVWDGERWLEGTAAIEFILALTGDPPELVPELPPPEPPRPARARASPYHGTGDSLGRRVARYLGRLPTGLGEGMGRDDVAYHLACFLSRDLALSDEVCLGWLERWDQQNAVRKGTAALTEILGNAKKYARHPVGCGLGDVRRGGHVLLTSRSEVGL